MSAVADTLLALLLLHDADRVNPRPLSPAEEFIAVHIRQCVAALCLVMAMARSQDDSKQRWVSEEALEFLAFVVVMMERALSGCLGKNTETCSPLAAVVMVITVVCAGVAWQSQRYLQQRRKPDGQQSMI